MQWLEIEKLKPFGSWILNKMERQTKKQKDVGEKEKEEEGRRQVQNLLKRENGLELDFSGWWNDGWF